MRLAWIDRAKGIAILLVVLHHVIQFSDDQPWSSDVFNHYNSMLQTLRMPLFFAMSGLFFLRTAENSWRWLFANRILPFVYLYVIWSVVWNLSFAVTPLETVGFGLDNLAANYDDPGVGPWYLYALALYFIAAKALSPLPVWCQLAIPVAIAIPLSAGAVELPWAWGFIGMYGAAFFAGMHGRELLTRLAARTTWPTVAAVAALWVAGTAVMVSVPHGRYLFVPLCAVGIALGVTLAAALRGADVLAWFGTRTLPVYLLHQPLIGAVYSLSLLRSLPAAPGVEPVVLIVTWLVTVAASVAIWRVTRAIPGIYVAPWYGSGNSTRARPPRTPPGTAAPGPGTHRDSC